MGKAECRCMFVQDLMICLHLMNKAGITTDKAVIPQKPIDISTINISIELVGGAQYHGQNVTTKVDYAPEGETLNYHVSTAAATNLPLKLATSQ